MSRIHSSSRQTPKQEPRPAPAPPVQRVTAHVERNLPPLRIPATRATSWHDWYPGLTDSADVRAIRNEERRRAELLADLPDPEEEE